MGTDSMEMQKDLFLERLIRNKEKILNQTNQFDRLQQTSFGINQQVNAIESEVTSLKIDVEYKELGKEMKNLKLNHYRKQIELTRHNIESTSKQID